MPRRCRGIRGDVGIAPYETTAEKTCVGADGAVRPNVTIPPSRLRRDTSLAEGGREIPRLRARRGDEGIAPYGREQGVRSQNGGRGRTPPLRTSGKGCFCGNGSVTS